MELDNIIAWLTDPTVIMVFCVVFATALISYLVGRMLDHMAIKVEATETPWDDAVVRSIRRPARWMIWIVGISSAADMVAAKGDTGFDDLIEPARYLAVVALIAVFLFRVSRELETAFIAKGADVTTVSAIGKLARVSVLITAALMSLETLGVSVSGILAFGGIGGIAVGFATKDLLANFFGGLMIYLDRPFAVGDWVRSPDREIEGTVVRIGWRLTEIRTFQQRPLYVPNSIFATIAIENPSRMRNRRIYETIGVWYDDLSKVSVIVEEIRELLRTHPDIDPARTLIVNFNAFGPSSLDFFVYTFTRTTDWVTYHGVKEKVLLQIADIIERHGAEMAFPTQTLHLAQLPDAEPEAPSS